jgi:hypothetical protein
VTGEKISVINDIFQNPIVGTFSLGSKLTIVARQEFQFDYTECIYGGQAAYEQIWTQINIRIQLNPDANVPAAPLAALQPVWAATIANASSNKFGLGLPGEITSPLQFQAIFTGGDVHHRVQLSKGPGRSNEGHWFTTIGSCVAHKFGHMFGLVDEYVDPACPNRNPVNTGTIMDNCSPTIVARFMFAFARAILSNIV